MLLFMSEKLTLEKLEKKLWSCAEILRGSIDSNEYKDYIFGLLFLKRVSDVFEEQKEKVDWPFKDDADFYDFFIPEKANFKNLLKFNDNLWEEINKVLELIEEENSTLEWVLVSIDYNNKNKLSDEAIKKLLDIMNEVNLRNDNLENPDILWQAYEYLIKNFADDSGKKWGEFYTPKEIVKLLAHLADIKEWMSICDPACWSGWILVSAINELKEKGLNHKNIIVHGQEKNRTTWAICKINMFLHNVLDARIEHGDTMKHPKLIEWWELIKYDRVLANPMWNQKEWHRDMFEKWDPYNRVKYGIPPMSSWDWIWMQHMLKSLKANWHMWIVLDNWVLFRWSAEWKIREWFIKDDLIECVIWLPDNLFYNTSAPGCIVVINKDKKEGRKWKILFIDASKDFEDGKNQNKLRDKDLVKITDTYLNFKEVDKYSKIVDFAEIEENDFNLNIARYVDWQDEVEQIDINKEYQELKTILEEREESRKKVDEFMKELGL